ncbi:MAG TPA: hypothetical protein VG755_18315 [Nannocystaceae bacterium]|nr:hypothetical protein [Nannocystaceae bacterium]
MIATSDGSALAQFPRLAAFVDGLPQGLDSYPEHGTKSALLRSLTTDELVGHASSLPAAIAELVRNPPPLSAWVRQTHAHAVVALARDVLFTSDRAFAQHCYDGQRALFSSRIYLLLMRCTSPGRLLTTAEKRWSQFNRGCTIRTDVFAGGAHIWVDHPPGMFEATSRTALTQALRATLDLSSARSTELTLVDASSEQTELLARW